MGNTGPPNNTQHGVSNAYREKRAMLRWWAAQAQLASEMPSSGPASVTIVPAGLVRLRYLLDRFDRLLRTRFGRFAQNVDNVHSMSREAMPANARSDPEDPKQTVVRATNVRVPLLPPFAVHVVVSC